MQSYKVFAINPGSTSTKIALFEGDREIFKKTVEHDADKLSEFATVADQLPYRVETILQVVKEQGVDISDCAAFVGRGGGLTLRRWPAGQRYNDYSRWRGGGNHPAALAARSQRALLKNMVQEPLSSIPTWTYLRRGQDYWFSEYRVPSIHALNQKETAIRGCRTGQDL